MLLKLTNAQLLFTSVIPPSTYSDLFICFSVLSPSKGVASTHRGADHKCDIGAMNVHKLLSELPLCHDCCGLSDQLKPLFSVRLTCPRHGNLFLIPKRAFPSLDI